MYFTGNKCFLLQEGFSSARQRHFCNKNVWESYVYHRIKFVLLERGKQGSTIFVLSFIKVQCLFQAQWNSIVILVHKKVHCVLKIMYSIASVTVLYWHGSLAFCLVAALLCVQCWPPQSPVCWALWRGTWLHSFWIWNKAGQRSHFHVSLLCAEQVQNPHLSLQGFQMLTSSRVSMSWAFSLIHMLTSRPCACYLISHIGPLAISFPLRHAHKTRFVTLFFQKYVSIQYCHWVRSVTSVTVDTGWRTGDRQTWLEPWRLKHVVSSECIQKVSVILQVRNSEEKPKWISPLI